MSGTCHGSRGGGKWRLQNYTITATIILVLNFRSPKLFQYKVNNKNEYTEESRLVCAQDKCNTRPSCKIEQNLLIEGAKMIIRHLPDFFGTYLFGSGSAKESKNVLVSVTSTLAAPSTSEKNTGSVRK